MQCECEGNYIMRRKRKSGFTLVELLVVIGIIAVLVSILLPALGRVREQARTIKCASNLRSVGQGLMIYVAGNRGYFPASYTYVGQQVRGGVETPNAAVNGYIHWSSYIYGMNANPTNPVSADAFLCPSLEKGGLPPANTTDDNHDFGIPNDAPGVVDQQVPRCAYTLNEAICPRNKFVLGFQGAQRVYRYVSASQIRNSSSTILGTEFPFNAQLVTDTGEVSGATVVKSHRPVHGFAALAGGGGSIYDMSQAAYSQGRPGIRRLIISDLSPNPQPPGANLCRLDWVGRNHSVHMEGPWLAGKTNFLYVDGHVETKDVRDTLKPFEWGDLFYSLDPGADITY